MVKFYQLVLKTVVCTLFAQTIHAQTQTPHYNTSIASFSNGFYDYLPQGYDPTGTTKYPVIIFFHGAGDLGNGSTAELPRLLQIGIPKLINDGNFPSSFTVNGQTSRFIVISPQFTQWPSKPDVVNSVQSIVNYVIQNYKADANRIYMTGLSMGGGFTVDFAGSNANNAKKLAAIVPIAQASYPVYSQGRIMAAANLPFWGTHNNGDPNVPPFQTTWYRDWINEAPAANPNAKATIFTSNLHDAWTQTYDPAFTENGLNIYQWMLQFQRADNSPLPVTLTDYRIVKSSATRATASWSTSNEINNHHFTIERSPNGIDFTSIGTVPAQNSGSNYSFVDDNPLNGDNYYRLSQTDIDGTTKYFNIIRLKFGERGKNIFVLAPNPATNQLQLKLEHEEKGDVVVVLLGSGGNIIKQWSFNKTNYEWTQLLNLSDVAAGSYLIQVKGKNFTQSQRFIRN